MRRLPLRSLVAVTACFGMLATFLVAQRGSAGRHYSRQSTYSTFSMTIGGKTVNRLLGAEVHIDPYHPLDGQKAPICQLVFRVPIEPDGMIAQWALAPNGPQRYKSVSLTIRGLRRRISHTWTIPRAYIQSLKEVEDNKQGAQHETFYHVALRGTVVQDNAVYDGSNLAQVKPESY